MLEKRALVTGSGRRLGRAMACALAERGWSVAIHYNSSQQGADETLRAVREAGGDGAMVQADLSSEADVEGLVDRAVEGLGGPLGLLINNASTFEADTLKDHSRQDWDYHMQVNLRAPVRLTQAFAAQCAPDSQGLVVNMIDQRVLKLNPNFFSYTLSKSALYTATTTMAQALAPNIRVNGIGPGPTMRNARQSEQDFRAQKQATLTEQGSPPGEIIRALLDLIDAQAVTGQMIAVDGGQHLIWQTPDIMDITE